MTPPSTTTVAGMLMLPAPTGEAVALAPGRITIEDGFIAAVVCSEAAGPPPDADLGGPGWLICPGFIDAHLHLPQVEAVGGFGLDLLAWLERVIFPAEQQWADAGRAEAAVAAALDELLSFGTTGFCAFSSIHPEATRRALEHAAARRLRCAIGQTVIDHSGPEQWLAPARQRVEETASLLETFPPHAPAPDGVACRTAAMVAPRFAPMCSMELMQGLAELATRHDALIASHIAETSEECELAAAAHGGLPYARIYEQAGVLGPRTLLGHGIHLDGPGREALARTGTTIVHCPTANRFLGSGTMNRPALSAAGVRLALGSDLGAGGERSMVRVARAMLELARPWGDVPPAAHAWWQITGGNADALGWPGAGRLEAGAEADLLAVRPPEGWERCTHPLERLLFAWDDRWLRAAWVDGRPAWSRSD